MTNPTSPLQNRILCANIGNRNFTWKGRSFPEFSPEEKKAWGGNFKAFSQRVLADFDQYEPDLDATIVNQILLHYRDKNLPGFDQVILYGSKQPSDDPKRTDQDTYWAGLVLAQLLVRDGLLRPDQAQVHSVNVDIADNDRLMLNYREAIRSINQRYHYPHVSICDAGGSPQQKVALKLMAEFMVEESQLTVLYVNAKTGAVDEVSQIEYRNMIVAEQIRSLVVKGQYKAALSLRKIEDLNKISTARSLGDRLTGMGYFLSIGNYPFYEKCLNATAQKQRVRLTFLPKQPDDLDVKLAKAQFLYRAGQHDTAILSFAVFYESYLSQVISRELGYDLLNNYHEENRRLREEAFERFDNVRAQFDRENFSDVKFKIAVALTIPGEAHQTFLTTLDAFIQGGPSQSGIMALNTVRNKIAHNGFIPDDQYMKKELAYFPELIGAGAQLMGLPADNLFETLNEAIFREM